MSEIWKPVVGYESAYEVSSLGQVRSIPHATIGRDGVAKRCQGRTLLPYLCFGKYPQVKLRRAEKVRSVMVSTLMKEVGFA